MHRMCLLLSLALAPSARAATPVYSDLGDWQLTCDNRNDCVAVARAVGYAGHLRISRAGGLRSVPQLELFAPGVSAPHWQVDGETPAFDDPGRALAPGHQQWTGMAAVRARLQSLQGGRVLNYGARDIESISLSGVDALLQAFDRAQGRSGTDDGLLPGTAAAQAHPRDALPTLSTPALARRVLSATARANLIADLRRLQAPALAQLHCDADDGSLSRAHDGAWAIDATHDLVFIGCQAGMYNANVVAFVVADGQLPHTRPLQLELADAPAVSDDETRFVLPRLGWPRFDAAQGRLVETTLFRGAADCGHAASWRWDGRQFQIETLQLQRNCIGGEPGDWPLLWRSVGGPTNVARQYGPLRAE
ncbi:MULTISPECIES: DUF1176 domain-containing protein [Stenotrophomonas]|uniref:DUF1176 domain-containing protein n=1 Tax=Stenotrophomonas TaxID=40323 RepID=UPI000D541D2D|nr:MULTISPECIES: DUF1176 domain-containing protein [Stenotrophomonas]AWH28753.1 hypothetical protein C1931_07380 [Stenotrophomonas sp. YAU14A_MKIMI4_1]